MPYGAPAPAEMFSHLRDPAAVAEQFDRYVGKLGKAVKRSDEGRDTWLAKSAGGDGRIHFDARPPQSLRDQRAADLAMLDRMAKGLGADQLAAMQADFDGMRD